MVTPIFVQPPLRLPELVDCHPFWHIQRSCRDGEYNCEVEDALTTVGHVSPFAEVTQLGARVKAAFHAYHVKFPCIVNTKRICAADEVVLKWHKEPIKRTYASVRAEVKQLAAIANLNRSAKKQKRE